MANLAVAAAAFALLHLLVSGTPLRGRLVDALGERVYLAVFSLASVAVLGWLIWAYGEVRVPAPTPWPGARAAAAALVLVATFLVVAGLLTPSPTVVGGERLLARGPAQPRGIHRITRHPFLWGVALWGVVHALMNPGVAHLVFFGTFAGVALVGTASIDAKRARAMGEAWRGYAALTSNVPFAAIGSGRNRLVLSELVVPALASLLAFAAFAALHSRFFGVAPW